MVERREHLRSVDSDFEDIYRGAVFSPTKLQAEVNVFRLIVRPQMADPAQAGRDIDVET
jgi:hypothetical protein